MKKDLLLEIDRIHEIMGVKPLITKTLLTEGKVLKWGAEVLRDWMGIAKKSVKNIPNVSNEVEFFGERMLKKEYDNIERSINNGNFDNLTPKELDSLTKIISKNLDLVDNLYNSFIDELINKGIKEKDMYRAMHTDISYGMPIEDAVYRALDDEPAFNLFADKIANGYNSLAKLKAPNDYDIYKFVRWMDSNIDDIKESLYLKYGDKSEQAFSSINSLFKEVARGNGDNIDKNTIQKTIPSDFGFKDEFLEFLTQDIKKHNYTPNSELSKIEYDNLMNSFQGSIPINGWRYFGKDPGVYSGWKYHVYGEDLRDASFIYQRLKPIIDKWGAYAKVAAETEFEPWSIQWGKKGASIYIPPKLIENGQYENFLYDINGALNDYTKEGGIYGDKSLNTFITYRYELKAPIDSKKGVDYTTYKNLYQRNTENATYKPSNVVDLFAIR